MGKTQKMVDWYKSWGFCGWLRLHPIWLAHRFIGDGLAEQWDFVCKHLPCGKQYTALDIGTTFSLFIYELNHRKFKVHSIDLRPYQERLPKKIIFHHKDIFFLDKRLKFDIITMISVLQYIDKKEKLFRKVDTHLKENGIFIFTVPTEKMELLTVMSFNKYFEYIDYQTYRGHTSVALIKKGIK